MKLFKNISKPVSDSLAIVTVTLLLLIPNIVLSVTEPLSALGRVVNIVVPLTFYVAVMAMSPKLGRAVWLLFPFIFLAAFQIVLLWLYGRSIIAVDMFLNLVTTNPGEAGELLGNMLPSIALVVVLYMPILVMSVIMIRSHYRVSPAAMRRTRFAAAGLGAVSVILVVATVATDRHWSVSHDLYPANAIYNFGLAIDRTARTERHDELSRDFRFDAVVADTAATPDIIVLVIGETSRADHWQINGYGRPTNPHLTKSPGRLWSFPRALSESNTTHKSVPLMLSHLTPETFGDSIFAVKSLITAFSEAGYKTSFISNQHHNRSFIDFFGAEADTTLYVKETGGLDRPDASDLELPAIAKGVMESNNGRQLVVLHTYGSHFSYRDRYPSALRLFAPDDYSDIAANQRDQLINAYDNTIVMTDSLLSALTHMLAGRKAAMIYCSDHGEDILDDRRGLFLHASPCPTLFQLHVPFLVWCSDRYVASRPELPAILDRNASARVSSNTAFFNTALDLGGVTTPRVETRLNSVVSAAYQTPRPLYLNDHNEAVEVEKSGLMDYEIEMIRKL